MTFSSPTERSPRAELAQAVERSALLHTHPAAAALPKLDSDIAETQARIDALAAELSAGGTGEHSDGNPTPLSPATT